jgi:hypothetical protein
MSVISGQAYSGTIRRPIEPVARISSLHLLLLVTLTLAIIVWGATLVSGARGNELWQYVAEAAFFIVACVFFVVTRLTGGFNGVFEIPVFMTLMAIVMFGLAPISCFVYPQTLSWNFHGDTSFFAPALEIVTVGMGAFWLGAVIVRTKKKAPPVADLASLPGSAPQMLTLVLAACIYIGAIGARIYMLRAGLFGYLQSYQATQSDLAQTQVWLVLEVFGFWAFVIFGIEAYFHPRDKFRAGLFWIVLASELYWGLLSGMKRPLFVTLTSVALLSSFAKGKLRIRWLVLVSLGFVAVYPLINSYRTMVHPKPTDFSVSNVGEASQAMQGAAMQSADQQRTAADWAASGLTSAMGRLDMTQEVALLLAYQDRAYLLQGDWQLWMIPFYPFIPRLIWPDKPVEDIGGRFTRLLTRGQDTISCTSPTVMGDLYILHGGYPGMIAGMFLIGLITQWLTNPVLRCPSKRNLFIYACMFITLANWENDFFAFMTGSIRSFVIVQVLALTVYGLPHAPSRVGMFLGRAVHRR